MNNYYKNKNILIIGGSYGIGESLCYKLAEFGANLAISARSEDKISKLCSKLQGNHLKFCCDITKESDLKNLQKNIFQKWQKIDLIIICAGIYQPMNLDNFDLKIAKNILDVNFNSFFTFLDIFLKDFQTEKITHLAVISSVAGYFGMPNSLAYGASKAGLSHLVESIYYELKKYKIKVQLINPAFVESRLTAKNNFKMPWIISSNQAAKIILKNLPKKKFEIAFPWIFVQILKLLQKLPYRLRLLLFR
jgi:short-subunit dehydrogenase